MGLHASIYRSVMRDCTNQGISYQRADVTIVNASGPFQPSDDAPAVLLVPGHLEGGVHAVPAELNDDGEWAPMRKPDHVGPMAGGNYIATSDSRFGELASSICGHRFYGAVSLHDRFETGEQYAAMSAD